jgi:hypothetical protein
MIPLDVISQMKERDGFIERKLKAPSASLFFFFFGSESFGIDLHTDFQSSNRTCVCANLELRCSLLQSMVGRAAGIEGSLVGAVLLGQCWAGEVVSAIVASTKKSGLIHAVLRIHSRQIYCASLSFDTSLTPSYLSLVRQKSRIQDNSQH